jgi:hypothetical protein
MILVVLADLNVGHGRTERRRRQRHRTQAGTSCNHYRCIGCFGPAAWSWPAAGPSAALDELAAAIDG